MKYQNTRRAIDKLLPLGLLVVAAKRLGMLDEAGANATMVNAFTQCADDIRSNVANRMFRLTTEYWPDPFAANDTPAFALGVLYWYKTLTEKGGLGFDHNGGEEALATTIFSKACTGVSGIPFNQLQQAGRKKGLDLYYVCERHMLYREYDLRKCRTEMLNEIKSGARHAGNTGA